MNGAKHRETWNLMDGAKHRVKTWYLMDGAESEDLEPNGWCRAQKVKTWYLMDGTKHSQQIKLHKLQE